MNKSVILNDEVFVGFNCCTAGSRERKIEDEQMERLSSRENQSNLIYTHDEK